MLGRFKDLGVSYSLGDAIDWKPNSHNDPVKPNILLLARGRDRLETNAQR